MKLRHVAIIVLGMAVLATPAAARDAGVQAGPHGYIYGTVETTSDHSYTGLLRWGTGLDLGRGLVLGVMVAGAVGGLVFGMLRAQSWSKAVPPRVPNGSPSKRSSWGRSSGNRKTSKFGNAGGAPTAARLTFLAAVR